MAMTPCPSETPVLPATPSVTSLQFVEVTQRLNQSLLILKRRTKMGNVQVLSQNTNNGELTEFQKNKLMFDFNTFFDLNNDGYLSYKVNKNLLKLSASDSLINHCFVCQDFQWAKDRICQMSGWKMNCAKYKATEKLFTDIWTSLVQVADTDNDGKITR